MIQAENLSFSYTGQRPYILDGINLDIKAGEYVSVVGENGCGKSTLMKLFLKFLKPTNGSIFLEAKRIGFVPQKNDFLNFAFPITVFEMLNSYRKILKVSNRDVISQSLGFVGLSDFPDSLVGTLSGGQHQKALIARALLGNPELLILDEPSTGVDLESQKEIYSLLKRLNVETGVTIISVEHNLDAAVSNSTLIYHLTGGQGHFCSPQKFAAEYLNAKRRSPDNA